ncbi:STM4012 family radical SAM protein [Parabacteroides sp. PF5-9]|uniref:STM4012 family radical SAM protein n=1 Tax=Parabacteroides sp. PF5-9 TaxID=1742404 RepID=UPI0024770FE2|nr:STM4012 family radical SAM protein [Parabacteroides sp. PF5-9]MDH6358517.1 oxygen-independent coproporphyrinogen-3 oxidase [Parabacteroides sp. PF5-9]
MNRRIPQYLQYMYSYPHKTAYRMLNPSVDIASYIKTLGKQDAGLYFHIPFCRYKCGFCNLFSEQGCNASRIDAYLDAVERHVLQLSELTEDLLFSSFAIGGGTPLVLTTGQLERLFNLALKFGISPEKVFTSIETSPDYASVDKLRLLKEKGISRLSMGVQSFLPGELKQIKRQTTIETVETALDAIAQIGFPQFNMDLIYGIEGQTVDSFLSIIQKAITYQPTELFLYPLYVRRGVRISTKARNELLFEMYKGGRDLLTGEGFTQTSMRRFVRNKTTDLEYTCGDETILSCGCGGRSYVGNFHFATPYAVSQPAIRSIIDAYIQTTDFTHITNGYFLSEEEKQQRYIIKNLMYYRGIEREDYRRRFETDLPAHLFQSLIDQGYVEDKGGFIRLTAEGMAFSDDIGQRFISSGVKERMDSYLLV